MERILDLIRELIAQDNIPEAVDYIRQYSSNSQVLFLLYPLFDELTPAQKKRFPYDNSYQVCLMSAIKGDQDAMLEMGKLYLQGSRFCFRNDEKAFKWILKAYQAGNQQAKELLIRCYREGIGTAQDMGKVVELKQENTHE